MENGSTALRETERWTLSLREPGFWADQAALVGLITLAIVFELINPTFLSAGNIRAILDASAILIILSVGQTFVIATGGIDLSVASAMTFGTVILGEIFRFGWGLVPACILSIVAGAFVGAINGALIGRGKITDFIVTLGTLSAASGGALILSSGEPITIISANLLRFATSSLWVFRTSFIIALVVAVLAHVVLFRARLGTHVLATGGSPEAANAMGISVASTKFAAYFISGLLAGLGGILFVARIGAAEPAVDTSFILNSVAAVVLGGVSLFGGRATILGPFVGAILLAALVNGLTLVGVSQFYQPLSVGIVVVLAAFLGRLRK